MPAGRNTCCWTAAGKGTPSLRSMMEPRMRKFELLYDHCVPGENWSGSVAKKDQKSERVLTSGSPAQKRGDRNRSGMPDDMVKR
jgi:hypothetical protein